MYFSKKFVNFVIVFGKKYYFLFQQMLQQQILFTPGPLLTTKSVKEACLIDMGSRDPEFIKIIKYIKQRLLDISNVSNEEYVAVLLQGSGTYAIEATLQSAINNTNHKVLVVINGQYGERQKKILQLINRKFVTVQYDENQQIDVEEIQNIVNDDPSITHVSIVHSETTSGILNNIYFNFNRRITYIVDAVSSFGAYDIDMKNIDFLISSSNKNIQGIPGFAFVISKIESLNQCKGNAQSLVLDLYDQEEAFKKNSQFRYTPPTHALRAFKQALIEHEFEGSSQGRFKRYSANQKLLSERMRKLGFELYLNEKDQGCIITTFLMPKNLNFQEFYDFLSQRNLVIYPGKLTKVDTFRIGSIGEIYPEHINQLVDTIEEYLKKQ
ncbi:hypothetical protein pb186bvf_007573 [Paramecium bursaria]